MGVVAPFQFARVDDVSELRFRAGTIKIGTRMTLVVCGGGLVYALATSERPNRVVIGALIALALASVVTIRLVEAEAIVRSRWREAFFLAWSLVDVAIIGVLQACDGGARSPAAFLYVLPTAFAALSYPMPAVVVISLANVATYTAVSVLVDPPGAAYILFVAATLACAAGLCVAQARHAARQRAELARASRTDPLTDALNRRGFEERLDAELGEARRGGTALGLLVLDLDDFKRVNDTHGHAARDELLCWVAGTVRAALRPVDALGRLGGDEFAVVLPRASRSDALEVAERVRGLLARRVRATVGVAAFPADGSDREDLHRHADAELYREKRASGVPARG
ncbi:MAG: GGDEF domain-containing protein [Thermoleophilaceae bacterium]|nr:GGDEF domain-containing protein [Thermoleophilaceae bacterium]